MAWSKIVLKNKLSNYSKEEGRSQFEGYNYLWKLPKLLDWGSEKSVVRHWNGGETVLGVANELLMCDREDWILRGPWSSSFWIPRNLSDHMIRQASIGNTIERWQGGPKHCRGGWGGRRGKDDRKQNTLAPFHCILCKRHRLLVSLTYDPKNEKYKYDFLYFLWYSLSLFSPY